MITKIVFTIGVILAVVMFTQWQLYRQVYAALNEARIEIPFPQRDLHLRSGKGDEADHPTRALMRAEEPDAAD